jgi:hypothetical protein
MTATTQLIQSNPVEFLSFDIIEINNEPFVGIDFKKTGDQLYLEIRAIDVLDLLRAAGKYTYESFATDLDGNHFVYEIQFQGDQDFEVKVKIEDRINSLRKKDFEAVILAAYNDQDYRNLICEIPF